MAKLLLIDDDQYIIQSLYAILEDKYDLEHAYTGQEGIEKATSSAYDLIILDLMLPDMTGTNICTAIRSKKILTPILMLTSINSSRQIEANLDAGADDYLTKPFEPNVILARIRAIMRRSTGAASGQQSATNLLISGDLSFDLKSRKFKKGEQSIHLLPREAALLEFFMRYPNQVFSPDALMKRVWESDSEATTDTVRSHIKSIRKKIDSDGQPSRITNLRGLGYRFENA